nr:hypothetical protein [Tanacetum cinerariifolium]
DCIGVQKDTRSEDPFNNYELINKEKYNNNGDLNFDDNLKYPPGFTLATDVDVQDNTLDELDVEGDNYVHNIQDDKIKLVEKNSPFNRSKNDTDRSVCSGQTMGYNMDGCMKNIGDIIDFQGVNDRGASTLEPRYRSDGFYSQKMGNEEDTLFWEDAWRGDNNFKSLYPRIAPRGGSEKSQFTQLLRNMEGFSLVDMKDRWIWSLEGCGKFLVASVRKVLDDRSLPVVSSKTRWIHAVPIKVNIHAWKVRLDSLPSRLNISKRGSKVGCIMSRTQSWNEIVNNILACLSKWKMKTLSIGEG